MDWQTRFHLVLTSTRLFVLTAALWMFGLNFMLQLFALNPFGMIFNLVLWDLVAGRFMAVEAQLAERDVRIDFPGRIAMSHIIEGYNKHLRPIRKKLGRGQEVEEAA